MSYIESFLMRLSKKDLVRKLLDYQGRLSNVLNEIKNNLNELKNKFCKIESASDISSTVNDKL